MLRRRVLTAHAFLAAALLAPTSAVQAKSRYPNDFRSMFHRNAELLPYSVGGKYGFVDSLGRIVVPAQFDEVGGLVEGAAAFRRGRLWGVVGRNARVLVEPAFDAAEVISEGMLAVAKGDGWTYLSTAQIASAAKGGFDPSGVSFVFSAESLKDGGTHLDAVGPFRDGYALVRLLRDGEGRPTNLIVFVARNLKPWAPGLLQPVCGFDAGVAAVRLSQEGALDPGVSIIDASGRRLGHVLGTREFGRFSEGLAAMCDEKGCGYVDRSGAVVLRAEGVSYSDEFHDGLAPIRRGTGGGYVDRSGKVVIPPEFRTVGDFQGGYAAVCAAEGRCGYIDTTGRAVIPLTHGHVVGFTAGVFVVGNKRGDEALYRYSYLGKNGKPVMKDVFGR